MSGTHASAIDLHVVAGVDIVIVGATSAAVSFALSAKRAGASVFVVSSRPYMGEDICAAYRFWPQPAEGNALADAIFGEQGRVSTPMHVKLTLEQSLVNAGIPYVFNCFPAGLLRSAQEQVCGIAIANRTGLQAIAARVVVDATLDGVVLQQGGHAGRLHRLCGLQDVVYATFCEGRGQNAAKVSTVELLPGYKTEAYEVSARRYRLSVDCGDGSPTALADAFGEVVDRCWVPEQYRHQVRILPQLPPAVATPSLAGLRAEQGLYGLTEALRLADGAEAAFCNPITAMRLAAAFGSAVAAGLPAAVQGERRVVCAGSEPVRNGVLHTLRDALRPGATGSGRVHFDQSSLPVLGRFDVVVVGGGTGGAPAAIGAARTGASALVIELTSGLGGVGTMGQIAKYWHGNRVGFTAEIDRGVDELEQCEKYKELTDRWSVSAKSSWYHQEGRRSGATYWFNSLCAGVCVRNGRVTAVLVAGPYGYGLVEAGCVVDATGCADVPAAAGAPTVVIGKEHIAVQGTGLAGQVPGREYTNSDHNFSDDTDVMDATALLTTTKLKFKDDFDCGELVDTRERRQIVGDYSINALDIICERTFPDTICRATSNFDSHGFTVDPVFMLMPADEKVSLWANIPLRCLLPQGLDGVLVTGLGISVHRDALPVVRMQPDVQNQGYAAGYIAAMSARRNAAIRDLDVREIQAHLVQNDSLPEAVLQQGDSFPLPQSEIVRAVQTGWDSLWGVAIVLHEPLRSLPVLRSAYLAQGGARSAQSLRYAQLLALLDSPEGQGELAETLAASPWDEGWRFRGMGQFGMTLSEVDKLLVCLGKVGDASAWPAVLEKVRTLPVDTEFSHIRALAMCCEELFARHPNGEIGAALIEVALRPGYRGHAQLSIVDAQNALTSDINENLVRDNALRELHLARALYACLGKGSMGEAILQAYAGDIRGHFARHAKAVLAH